MLRCAVLRRAALAVLPCCTALPERCRGQIAACFSPPTGLPPRSAIQICCLPVTCLPTRPPPRRGRAHLSGGHGGGGAAPARQAARQRGPHGEPCCCMWPALCFVLGATCAVASDCPCCCCCCCSAAGGGAHSLLPPSGLPTVSSICLPWPYTTRPLCCRALGWRPLGATPWLRTRARRKRPARMLGTFGEHTGCCHATFGWICACVGGHLGATPAVHCCRSSEPVDCSWPDSLETAPPCLFPMQPIPQPPAGPAGRAAKPAVPSAARSLRKQAGLPQCFLQCPPAPASSRCDPVA